MKWSAYEIYKNKISILLTLVLSVGFVALFWRRNTSGVAVTAYSYQYFFAVSVGMFFVSTRIFMGDIRTGAIKTLLTGRFSRITIFYKRLLNNLCITLIFFLGSQIVTVVSMYRINNSFNFNLLISSFLPLLFIYIANVCIISVYVAIVCYKFKKLQTVYFMSILLPITIRYILPLLITISTKVKILEKFLALSPSSILIRWAFSWQITAVQLTVFVIWLVVLFVVVNFVINKKEL